MNSLESRMKFVTFVFDYNIIPRQVDIKKNNNIYERNSSMACEI